MYNLLNSYVDYNAIQSVYMCVFMYENYYFFLFLIFLFKIFLFLILIFPFNYLYV